MKISFVVPAYNEEAIIKKCLDSIFRELAGKNFDAEVIVVDNASTDRTAKIVRGFPDVKLVYEPKKGLVSARQAGYLAASGNLIANIDADTMLTPGWIEKVLKEFSKDQKLVALSGPFIYYDISAFVRALVRVHYSIAYFLYLINNHLLGTSSVLQGGNFVVRKSALDKLGGYNTNFDFWGEDTEIARMLRSSGKVKFTFRLPAYSSGRRLMAEGILRTSLNYGINYFSVIFRGKPHTKEVRHIRLNKESKLDAHSRPKE